MYKKGNVQAYINTRSPAMNLPGIKSKKLFKYGKRSFGYKSEGLAFGEVHGYSVFLLLKKAAPFPAKS